MKRLKKKGTLYKGFTGILAFIVCFGMLDMMHVVADGDTPTLLAAGDGTSPTIVKNAHVNGESIDNGTEGNPVNVVPGDTITYDLTLHVPSPSEPIVEQPKTLEIPSKLNFINGSFEEPSLGDNSNMNYLVEEVPGWHTRPNPAYVDDPNAQVIEIQKAGTNLAQGFARNTPDGTQYAELDAFVPGTLYQILSTTPGTKVYYEFYHGARGVASGTNTDVMNFYLRAPGESDGLEVVASDSYVRGSTEYNWGHYTGSYIVPEGQTETEFAFQAVSTTSGYAKTTGNYLDGIRLYTQSYIDLTKSNNASDTGVQGGDIVTYTIQAQNHGESDASNVVISDILPIGTSLVDGSVKIDGTATPNYTYDATTRAIQVHTGGGATADIGGIIKGDGSFSSDANNAYTITFDVTVDDATRGLYENQATVVHTDRYHEDEGSYTNYSNLSTFHSSDTLTATVTDILPDGLTYVSSTDANGSTFTINGQEAVWNWEDLPYGTTTVSITAKVDPDTEVLFDNQAIMNIEGTILQTDHTYHQIIAADVPLTITKNLSGDTPPIDAYFTFSLVGEDEAPMPDDFTEQTMEKTKFGPGEVDFGTIHFTTEGTYIYTIKEETGTDNGYTYDTTEYRIIITVRDNNGVVETTITKTDEENNPITDMTFDNVYTQKPGSLELTAQKTLIGKDIEDEEFSFIVTEAGIEVARGTNDADGNIAFSPINYEETGIHTYVIQEIKGTEEGIDYDEKTYTITVEVSDVDSQLTATVIDMPDGGITFENRNPVPPTIVKKAQGTDGVNDGEQEAVLVLSGKEEEVIYTIDVLIPEDVSGYKSLVISDALVPELEMVSGPTIASENGSALSGTWANDGGTISYSFANGFDYRTIAGQTVTMTMRARIKTEVTEEQVVAEYGSLNIPNQGSFNINGHGEVPSNIVEITPPPIYPEMVKTISGSDGINDVAKDNQLVLSADDEEINYTIEVMMPDNMVGYESLVISDTLVDELTLVGTPTVVSDGTVLDGTWNIAGNTISYVFADGFDYDTIAGQTITMTIKAKINDGITREDIIAIYGTTSIPNQANFNVNTQGEVPSNVVEVIPPVISPEIEKKVDGSDGVNDTAMDNQLALSRQNEEFSYTVEITMPEDSTGYQSLIISDTLAPELTVVEIPTIESTEGTLLNGTWNNVGNAISYSFADGFDYRTIAGQTITMTIKAKIKDGITRQNLVATYGTTSIPNQANFNVNTQGNVSSNVVEVIPPLVNPKISKMIRGSDGINDTAIDNQLVLSATDEEFIYTVQVLMPEDTMGYQSLVISDTLAPELLLVEDPSIVSEDGTTVNGTWNTVGNAISYSFADDFDYSTIAGQVITMTIKAKINDGITREDLVTAYGTASIPNQAIANVNTQGSVPSNIVKVTPVPVNPEVEKAVSGSDGVNDIAKDNQLVLSTNGEEIIYTVQVTIPEDVTGYQSLVINDTLASELTLVEEPIIVNEEGTAVNGIWNTATKNISFSFAGGFDYRTIAGQTITMTIKAKISDGITREDIVTAYGTASIPNQASFTLNSQEDVPSNVVEVTPPPVNPEVEKTVSGSDGIDDTAIDNQLILTKNNEEFIYTVQVTIPEDVTGYQSLVIHDTLVPELTVMEDPTIVSEEETDVMGTWNNERNTIEYVFANDFDYRTIAGQVITITIKAKIMNGITREDVIAKYGNTNVPNQANVTINSQGEVLSNIVNVSLPAITSNPVVTPNSTVSQTGDTSNIGGYGVFALVSMFFGLLIRKRREEV